MIPKIIHYCWFGSKPKPKDVINYINSWKKYMPDYEIKEWNEQTFDFNQYIFSSQAFQAKKYAFVADVARLWALYNYGGIYFDTDIEVIKSFNPLLKSDYFLGYESEKIIGTGTMGFSQYNELVGDFLESYKDRQFILEKGHYNVIPNTFLLTELVEQKEHIFDIFPSDYFTAHENQKVHITDNTYCIHHFAGTWLPWYCILEKRIFKILGLKYKAYIQRHIYCK